MWWAEMTEAIKKYDFKKRLPVEFEIFSISNLYKHHKEASHGYSIASGDVEKQNDFPL